MEYWILFSLVTFLIGVASGYFIRRYISKLKISSAEEIAEKIIEESRQKAEDLKKEAILEAKDQIHQDRQELEREARATRAELQKLESRLLKKEEDIEEKSRIWSKKDAELKEKEEGLNLREGRLKEMEQEWRQKLEAISGISAEEAKEELIASLVEEAEHEASKMIRQIEEEAKISAEKKGREVITQAIQRCAGEHVSDTTVSVVTLPNDEMKGRVIGREGRNIRTLETLTGVDLIIDDTPEAVILSGFDAVRREIAKISLERLIMDGRIHPARIEEVVSKVQEEMEEKIKEEGEQVTFELGIPGIPSEAIMLLGKLKYRTSYGQNVLVHSKEVAILGTVMAAELGADASLVKRAGLLHDIGKAISSETEGAHAAVGADLLKRFGEAKGVIHAVAAHHADIEPKTVEAVLVQAADAISAARPGARRENLETYIKRLEKLEQIANSFSGVEKSYAIQAGREVRVIVESDKVDDEGAYILARQISRKIERELEYPGQIKVTVIRETRVVELAR